GYTGAANESDPAIDDQQFAMGAVVISRQVVPSRIVVPGQVPAGFLEFRKVPARSAGAANGVDHNVYFYSCARTFGQRLHEALCDLASLENVSFQVYAAFCRCNRPQLLFIKTRTIGKNLEVCGVVHLRVGESLERRKEMI